METTVVNIKNSKFDVYIGRHKDPVIGKWGNPFSSKDSKITSIRTKSRKESIEKYKEWILQQPELMASLNELKGKRLGCFCKPKACHGDVLVELVNNIDIKSF